MVSLIVTILTPNLESYNIRKIWYNIHLNFGKCVVSFIFDILTGQVSVKLYLTYIYIYN